MATIIKNSLLGIPAELRVRIYRHVFHNADNSIIRVRMSSDFPDALDEDHHRDVCKPSDASSTSVDAGITIACKVLREESMPLVKEALSLHAVLASDFDGPGTFPVKAQYLTSIRHAHVLFASADWSIPYKELTSLEVLRLEYCEIDSPLRLFVGIKTFESWAAASDVDSVVEAVKKEARSMNFSHEDMQTMLENKSRGFRIECLDYFQTCLGGEVTVRGPHTIDEINADSS